MFGLENHIIHLIRNEILTHKNIQDIIVFGSRAKGNYQKGSDIDIALKGTDISFELIARLKAKFNQLMPIPYHVDIVRYEDVTNTDLTDHIDSVGISILDSEIFDDK